MREWQHPSIERRSWTYPHTRTELPLTSTPATYWISSASSPANFKQKRHGPTTCSCVHLLPNHCKIGFVPLLLSSSFELPLTTTSAIRFPSASTLRISNMTSIASQNGINHHAHVLASYQITGAKNWAPSPDHSKSDLAP
jgi:hypothetical protein